MAYKHRDAVRQVAAAGKTAHAIPTASPFDPAVREFTIPCSGWLWRFRQCQCRDTGPSGCRSCLRSSRRARAWAACHAMAESRGGNLDKNFIAFSEPASSCNGSSPVIHENCLLPHVPSFPDKTVPESVPFPLWSGHGAPLPVFP